MRTLFYALVVVGNLAGAVQGLAQGLPNTDALAAAPSGEPCRLA